MGRISHTERIARGLLKHYLPNERVIYNARPEWIVNPDTNQALEIDILYPDLKLAIEIQGVQHLRYTPGLHKDYQDFVEQQARDRIKMQAIMAAGYTFKAFSIFELLPYRFDPFIKDFMKQHGRLAQYHRTTPPRLLYAQAERLSRAKVPTKTAQTHRKPGLWGLIKQWILS